MKDTSISATEKRPERFADCFIGLALVAAYICSPVVSIAVLLVLISWLLLATLLKSEVGKLIHRTYDFIHALQLSVVAVAVSYYSNESAFLISIPVFLGLVFVSQRWALSMPVVVIVVYEVITGQDDNFWPFLLWSVVVLFTFVLHRRLQLLNEGIQIFNGSAGKYATLANAHLHFVEKVGKGEYPNENHFDADDELGNRLFEMSLQFKKSAEAERIRSWEMSGLNDVAGILRDSTDVSSAYKKLISFLVKYVSVNQGGLFIASQEDDNVFLELQACYAYERHKMDQRRLNIHEGLIGQCVLEKELIYIERIPENYVRITSGLGLATPRSLVIVPLKHGDDVVGVLEFASLAALQKNELDFLRKAAEIIGASVLTWKKNIDTNLMLEQSREMAEELKAQQEEARQNLEELQATQEHLTREAKEREKLQIELNKSKEFLNLVLDSVPVPVFVKDRQHKMVLVNKAVCDLNKMTKEQMLGKSDYDFFDKEEADIFWRFEEDIFLSGKGAEKIERATRNGKETHTIDKKLVVKTDDGENYLVGINIDLMQTADAATR